MPKEGDGQSQYPTTDCSYSSLHGYLRMAVSAKDVQKALQATFLARAYQSAACDIILTAL